MKKEITLFIFILFALALPAFGQDIIKTKVGETIKARIIADSIGIIWYKSYYFQDGPDMKKSKKDISAIQYQDGRSVIYEAETSAPSGNAPPVNSVNNADLYKTLDKLSAQLSDLNKAQLAQTRSVNETLASLNDKITALQAQLNATNSQVQRLNESGNSKNQPRNDNSNSGYQSNSAPVNNGYNANNDQRNSNAYNQDGYQARNNNENNSYNSSTQQRSNTAGNYPRPDFNNVPCFFNESSQSLQNLERVAATGQNKATGLWGTETLYVLHGESSPVRFHQGDKLQFIVALQNERSDPNTECDLNICTINKKHQQREYVGAKAGMGHAETVSNVVSLNFKPLGNGMFLITVNGQIPRGELFFAVKGVEVFYAFGVD